MPILKIARFYQISAYPSKKNDSNSALFTNMEILKGINMSEKTLFGRESKCKRSLSLLKLLSQISIAISLSVKTLRLSLYIQIKSNHISVNYSLYFIQCLVHNVKQLIFLFANLRIKLKFRSGYCLLSPSGYREGYREI